MANLHLVCRPQPQPRTVVSTRMLEVLVRVAEGMSTDEIASDLGLSRNTIRVHLVNCFQRLNAMNRAHAVMLAIREGYLAFEVGRGEEE